MITTIRNYGLALYEKVTAFLPHVLLVRTFDGTCVGMAISTLVTGRGRTVLYCDRDLKANMDPEAEVKNVGLALLIGRLSYMKKSGFWGYRAEILTGYDPNVSNSYRRRLGMTPSFYLYRDLDSFTGAEGERVLSAYKTTFSL